MSMFVNVVRVTPATFSKLQAEPALFEGVLDGDAAILKQLGIAEDDSQGFDYGIADDMMDAEANLAMDEDEEEEDEDDEKAKKKKPAADDDEDDGDDDDDEDAVFKELGADGKLAYDAGYGPAYTLSPAAVKKAVKSSSVVGLDDDVKKLFKAAAKRGDYVIAIVT